jgi:hypothetical protein
MVDSAVPGLAPEIDYTARTFDVIRTRALELLKNRVGSFRYGAFLATDVVPAVIDVLAWFHEQNAHYYDRTQRNSLLELADTREAMALLTQAQGYRMRPAAAASVAVQATISPTLPVPVTLLRGTRIQVEDLSFEVAVDTIIPAGVSLWPDGTTPDQIVLSEGTTRSDSFVSDGTPDQVFVLGQPGTIDGSVSTTVLDAPWMETASLVFNEGSQRGRDSFVGTGLDGQQYVLTLLHALIDPNDEDRLIVFVIPPGGAPSDAEMWLQVTAFTGAPREFTVSQTVDGTTTVKFGAAVSGSAPLEDSHVDVLYLIAGAQKRYQLTYDADNRGTLRFGNGSQGVIPPAGARIVTTYRTGGGVRGNVAEGAIDTLIQGVLPSGGRTGVQISNAEAASGGEEQETVEHARFFAPRFAKANQRAVTKEDWTALAATYLDPLYGAPAHANAFLKQRIPELNTVVVAVWARDANGALTTAGTPLKTGIKNFLDSRRTITTVTEMADGRVMLVDIEADVTLEAGKIRQTVFAAVSTAVSRFFASASVLPGFDLSISKLYAAIQAVDGVAHATITKMVCYAAETLVLGTGNGVTALFSGDVLLADGTAVTPFSVLITDGTQEITDNGLGSFVGRVAVIAPGDPGNTFNYETGRFSVQFFNPPLLGATVTARVGKTLFFATTEDLGGSDGTVNSVDGATAYFPILKRGPRGVWSGDQAKVIDSFQIATTVQMRGKLPSGITPGTLVITDSTGVPQTVTDSGGIGILFQGFVAVGTVSYVTGDIVFSWLAAPTKVMRARWNTQRMDFTLPADYLPTTKGRVFFWGGFDADAAQPGAQLIAVDDGDGNIVGNVVPGGSILNETGKVLADWNVAPPPGPGGGATVVATLTQVPNGILKTFDFTTGSNLSRTGLDGEGRLRFRLTDLATPGVAFEDAYDNWQSGIHGASLDRNGDNFLTYLTGVGRITFLVPPAATAPLTFAIKVTNVAVLLYSAFVFRVKNPASAGLDAGLFADNNGRFWGPPGSGPVNPFPTDRLDHLRGRYIAELASGFIPSGRTLELTYDALQGVPPALDVVVASDQVAAPGRVALSEKPPEVLANA